MAIWQAMDTPQKAARAAAILCLVGAINLPIIKFSVDWWNTLHQPSSVLKMGGPAIHSSILTPLLVMATGFTLAFIAMHLKAMRNEILRRRLKALRQIEAQRGERHDAATGSV